MQRRGRRLTDATAGVVVVLLAFGAWWKYSNTNPTINIPTPKLPEPNAFEYYVKAAKLHATLARTTPGAGAIDPVTDSRSTTELTPQQLARQYPTAKKVAWVKKNAQALATLRQGFAYEYREPPNRVPAVIFPHHTQYRSLARLMLIESHSRSEQGDWAGASRSTLDILRLGHDTPRGAVLIGALHGYGINGIGRRELQKILPHLDANAARAAAQEIEKLQARRVTFAETLQEEKWFGLTNLQQQMPACGVGLSKSTRTTFTWKDLANLSFYTKRNVINSYVRYIDAIIAQSKQPYLKQQAPTIPKDPFNQLVLPAIIKAKWNAARNETGNNILMVQLALHSFQLEKGRLPDTLQELTSGYLKQIPRDPFGGGEILRYHRAGKTYLLYSIGSDGKDDGGNPVDSPAARANSKNRYLLQPDSKGDYVAGINR